MVDRRGPPKFRVLSGWSGLPWPGPQTDPIPLRAHVAPPAPPLVGGPALPTLEDPLPPSSPPPALPTLERPTETPSSPANPTEGLYDLPGLLKRLWSVAEARHSALLTAPSPPPAPPTPVVELAPPTPSSPAPAIERPRPVTEDRTWAIEPPPTVAPLPQPPTLLAWLPVLLPPATAWSERPAPPAPPPPRTALKWTHLGCHFNDAWRVRRARLARYHHLTYEFEPTPRSERRRGDGTRGH